MYGGVKEKKGMRRASGGREGCFIGKERWSE